MHSLVCAILHRMSATLSELRPLRLIAAALALLAQAVPEQSVLALQLVSAQGQEEFMHEIVPKPTH